ncbi:MAG: hypothetical protein ACREXR_13710 [Gammaproteobacteria bacterium]
MKCVRWLFDFFFAGCLAASAFALDVYVETNYMNQPDLRPYGVKKLGGHPPFGAGMLYEGNLWAAGQDKNLLPSKNRLTNFTNAIFGVDYKGLLVIDLETWPLYGKSDAIVNTYLDKYLTLLGWVKELAPGAKVGYYGKPPTSNWSAPQQGEASLLYNDWQVKNAKIASLAAAVDAFFPSIYTYSAKDSAWVNYATAMVKETRRYGTGKKIYPVINPEYGFKSALQFDLIPEASVLLQLKTLKNLGVDGVIIWAWGSQNTPWNANLPWWQATLKFLGSQ